MWYISVETVEGVGVKSWTCSGWIASSREAKTAQGLHVRFAAAGMGRDQVVGEELLLARLRREAAEEVAEGQEGLPARFPHAGQDPFLRVLGGDLHLPGGVVADDLAEVGDALLAVREDQVGADPRGDDGLLDPRESAGAF